MVSHNSGPVRPVYKVWKVCENVTYKYVKYVKDMTYKYVKYGIISLQNALIIDLSPTLSIGYV